MDFENCREIFFRETSGKCKQFIRALTVGLFALCTLASLWLVRELWTFYKIRVALLEAQLPSFLRLNHGLVLDVCLLWVFLVGAYGALRQSRRHLKMFAALICAYALIRYWLKCPNLPPILDYYNWSSLVTLQETLRFFETMTNYAREYQRNVPAGKEPNEATRAWDVLQTRLMCCGLHGRDDWYKGGLFNATENMRPKSCCIDFLLGSVREGTCLWTAQINFREGCLDKLVNQVGMTGNLLGRLGDSLALLLLGVVVFVVAGRLGPKVNAKAPVGEHATDFARDAGRVAPVALEGMYPSKVSPR